MVRVLICDDAVAFATLVTHWLERCPDLEVVGVAKSGREAVESVADLQPDVIVLDHLLHDVPGGSESLAPQLRARHPGLAVVLMSGMPEADLAAVAERCGADAFLSKASRPERLCETVREAAEGTRPKGAHRAA